MRPLVKAKGVIRDRLGNALPIRVRLQSLLADVHGDSIQMLRLLVAKRRQNLHLFRVDPHFLSCIISARLS